MVDPNTPDTQTEQNVGSIRNDGKRSSFAMLPIPQSRFVIWLNIALSTVVATIGFGVGFGEGYLSAQEVILFGVVTAALLFLLLNYVTIIFEDRAAAAEARAAKAVASAECMEDEVRLKFEAVQEAACHGEAAAHWGEDSDPGLSDLGYQQASHASAALLGLIDTDTRLISSPMLRARQTSEPLALALGASVAIDPCFREIQAPVGLKDRPEWIKKFMQEA